MKLYKYLAPDLFDLVFNRPGHIGLKCSYPRDFNDPYELFLGIDTDKVSPEVIAFYQETLGEVPQQPTLCFAKRPDVVPMWAHYARESQGFLVEIEESSLLELFADPVIQDISYSNTALIIDSGRVAHAYMTGKPRHTYFLQRAAFNSAYFTKSNYWSYEFERRLVIKEVNVEVIGGVMILFIPLSKISAISCGAKTPPVLEEKIKNLCKAESMKFLKMRIGKSAMTSFFIDENDSPLVFKEPTLTEPDNWCEDCSEPLKAESDSKCHWCSVSEGMKLNAARRNPFRMLSHAGLLDEYFRGMDKVGKGQK